jgi:hypothetical protein
MAFFFILYHFYHLSQLDELCHVKSNHIVTRLRYAAMPSGFFRIGLARHDDGNPPGEVWYTLTMTGVKTG